jgi:group I intron endonuclease
MTKTLPEYRCRRENAVTKVGIYKITNPNGLVYIGSSRSIYKRWLRHREGNKKTKLHSSISEFGWKNHIFEISHQLPLDISDEILLIYEQLYIDAYKNANYEMLNVKDAGSKAKFSEESKKLMSLSRKGRIPWNKGLKNAQIAWNKGLKYSIIKK